jgi:hypothetical protein
VTFGVNSTSNPAMSQRIFTHLLRRTLPPLAFGLFLAAAPASAQTPLPESPRAPKVGEKAPDFTLPDTEGKPVSRPRCSSPPKPAKRT